MKEGAAKAIWLLIAPSHFTVRAASRFWDTLFVVDWVFLLNLLSFLRVNSKTAQENLYSSNFPNVSRILLLQASLFKKTRRVKG